MVWWGFEPITTECWAQTNPLSYCALPRNVLCTVHNNFGRVAITYCKLQRLCIEMYFALPISGEVYNKSLYSTKAA